jgi:hypothetical protein
VTGIWKIWGKVRRRGGRVSIPEIGSRGDVFVFGGILGFCAELRRELGKEEFKIWCLGGVLRREGGRGGNLCVLSELFVLVVGFVSI